MQCAVILVNLFQGSRYSVFSYDAAWLYLLLLNESLSEGLDWRSGNLLFSKARNRTFQGKSGTVMIGEKGDRNPDYWLWSLRPGDDEYHPFLKIRLTQPPGPEVRRGGGLGFRG